MNSPTEQESNENRCATSANGFKQQDAEEVEISMPWGHISDTGRMKKKCSELVDEIFVTNDLGKRWGPKDVDPVICLHGWQDNSGSFDNLAPLLAENLAVLAIDLTGHGFSSHLPAGLFYYVFWDGLLLLRRIVKHYKLEKIKIMGHSLGGAIGFLYAATFPDEVDSLICLDIASPSVKNVDDTATTSGVLIDRFLKYEKLTLENVPCYDYKEMIDVVEDAYHGSITRESAEVLMKRGMMPATTPDRYFFSRDPRLKSSILGMLSLDLVMAYASKIRCAYLNIRAVPGLKFDEPANYQRVVDEIKKNARKFEYHEVPGTHHVHLNEPEKVAPIITAFLSS